MTSIEKWWAMTCTQCGGLIPIGVVVAGDHVPRHSNGIANCVRCRAPNLFTVTSLFVSSVERRRRTTLAHQHLGEAT